MAIEVKKEKVAGTPRLWYRHPIGASQCPGCHYPLIQRLVCELLEEMGLEGRAIANNGSGCAALVSFALAIDSSVSAHGRPADVATAIKRVRPDAFVFNLQGDGDCVAIGAEGLIAAASRGEKFTIIMLNNGGYAMTGGQMAPTTLVGQITSTTPEGRDPQRHGYPIRAAEMIATLQGVAYSARGSVHTPSNYQRTKKMVKTAFQKQLDEVGFSFVEIISACPTDWHLTPKESLEWIEREVLPKFPLGEFKNVDQLI